jgi:hypothetical protein
LPASFIEQKEKIVGMLDDALRQHFPRAEEAHGGFRKILEDRRPPEPQELFNVRQRHDELIAQLKAIHERMGQVVGITRLAQHLTELIKAELEIKVRLADMLRKREDIELDRFGTVMLKGPIIEIAKGEKLVVTLDMIRDQVDGELELRLDVPKDSGVTAPGKVPVARMGKNAVFEVTASNIAGEFRIPITVLNMDNEAVKWTDPKLPFVLTVKVK